MFKGFFCNQITLNLQRYNDKSLKNYEFPITLNKNVK